MVLMIRINKVKNLLSLCISAIVLLTSCSNSIEDKVAHLNKIDLSRFKNESIYYRDAFTIFISSVNSGPYAVRLNEVSRNSITEVDYNLVEENDLRSEKELIDLANAFMELNVVRIDCDSSMNFYFALKDVEKLDLLKSNGTSPDGNDWVYIKGNWYKKE